MPKHTTINECEEALQKAAKFICNLKCGACPLKETDFSGCQVDCREDIKPWQCWVAHFKNIGKLSNNDASHPQ